MTYVILFLVGAFVGSALTYAFRGAIQHEKDAVGLEIAQVEEKIETKL